MKIIAFIPMLLIGLMASESIYSAKIKQFPEDNHVYIPNTDVGMTKYRTKSMHGTKKIVLTYDDGPHPTRTPQILDLLKKYNATATFFILTNNLNEKTIPLVKRMIDEGHFVASHDHDHDDNNGENEATYKAELIKTVTTIENFTDSLGVHQREMYYRFPYGAYGKNRLYHHMNVMKQVSNELYGDNCINFAFWDIDTADWVPDMTPEDVAQAVKGNMEGGTAFTHQRVTVNGRAVWKKKAYTVSNPPAGGVILMHDVQEKTIKGSELLLEMAKEKGWEIVPLNYATEFNYQNKECIFKGR